MIILLCGVALALSVALLVRDDEAALPSSAPARHAHASSESTHALIAISSPRAASARRERPALPADPDQRRAGFERYAGRGAGQWNLVATLCEQAGRTDLSRESLDIGARLVAIADGASAEHDLDQLLADALEVLDQVERDLVGGPALDGFRAVLRDQLEALARDDVPAPKDDDEHVRADDDSEDESDNQPGDTP